MAETLLAPFAGINNVAEDAALQRGGDAPRLFVRDAVNVNLTPEGAAELRPGLRQVSSLTYGNVWQSPLHKDTFGTLLGQWVRIFPETWECEPLALIGEGDVSHELLNNSICVATPAGIFTYNGANASLLTIETPAAPFVMTAAGSLPAGAYGVAVAWLRGAIESATSAMASVDVPQNGGLDITLPMCFDSTVTGARLYLTKQNGGELALEGDYPLGSQIQVLVPPKLGRPTQFQHLSAMPSGKYLKYWRGRLVVAKANVLRFSEPLAYHLHNERHSFVQLPQRITFVEPVDGGLWVGQVDHVVFLDGASPDAMSVTRRASSAPVPGSSMLVTPDIMGSNSAPSGELTAVWLAANGYVGGTAQGQLIQPHAGVLRGITGRAGTSVVLDRRLITAVT